MPPAERRRIRAMLEPSRSSRNDLLSPLFAVLDGAVVSYAELVEAGRRLAGGLVKRGKPMILSDDEDSLGVWDLERLSDREAVTWGLLVALEVRRP
jgi:hypothetical protein